MSALEYTQRAKEIRDRLRRPANAVIDTGINLRPLSSPTARAAAMAAAMAALIRVPPPPMDARVFISEIPCRSRCVRVNDIIRTTARHFGVKPEEVRGSSRRPWIVEARHVAIYLAFRLANPERSSPQIARDIGLIDHTSVLYARNKILRRIQTDAVLLDKIRIIEGDILEPSND